VKTDKLRHGGAIEAIELAVGLVWDKNCNLESKHPKKPVIV
jgi:hypothetical protein